MTPPTLKSLAALATKASPDDVWPYATVNDDGDLVFTKEAMAIILRVSPETLLIIYEKIQEIERLTSNSACPSAHINAVNALALLDGQSHAEGENP